MTKGGKVSSRLVSRWLHHDESRGDTFWSCPAGRSSSACRQSGTLTGCVPATSGNVSRDLVSAWTSQSRRCLDTTSHVINPRSVFGSAADLLHLNLLAMQLKHIDNGFYLLTAHQARTLAVDGKLPRPGYMKQATVPADLVLLRAARHPDRLGNIIWEPRPFDVASATGGWIMQTPCSWHDGAVVEDHFVWSVVFCFKARIGEKWIWHAR